MTVASVPAARRDNVRFKDIPVGSVFHGYLFGMSNVNLTKVTENSARANKINSPGTVDIPINPELNQDDWTLGPYKPHPAFRPITDGVNY